jgi:2-keto-4-pentenoate hydratase/2-oxohepta-3-ene-1,7-dioic acid hydratase in catechol pathway
LFWLFGLDSWANKRSTAGWQDQVTGGANFCLGKKTLSLATKRSIMKLFRHGTPGDERPGFLLADEEPRDLSLFGEDFDADFFSSGGISRLKEWVIKNPGKYPLIEPRVSRYGPPIKTPSKLVCIGLNYSDHAKETGTQLPPEPIIFFKSTTAITGPNDPVVIPKGSQKTDWEVELAVVLGKKASYVQQADALDYVAGYMLHNDYSERAFQLERAGQWVKGKSCDTFAPIGPYLVTPEEIPDLDQLRLWLKVNDKTMQDGNNRNLVFKVPYLISYVSQFMTLLPGDIISTGTPPGVGMGQKPHPIYLKPGDVVELGIDGLGSAKQQLVPWQPGRP